MLAEEKREQRLAGAVCLLELGPSRDASERPPPLAVRTVSPYDASADGQRFLVNTALEEEAPSPMTVVFNWTATLKK